MAGEGSRMSLTLALYWHSLLAFIECKLRHAVGRLDKSKRTKIVGRLESQKYIVGRLESQNVGFRCIKKKKVQSVPCHVNSQLSKLSLLRTTPVCPHLVSLWLIQAMGKAI